MSNAERGFIATVTAAFVVLVVVLLVPAIADTTQAHDIDDCIASHIEQGARYSDAVIVCSTP